MIERKNAPDILNFVSKKWGILPHEVIFHKTYSPNPELGHTFHYSLQPRENYTVAILYPDQNSKGGEMTKAWPTLIDEKVDGYILQDEADPKTFGEK